MKKLLMLVSLALLPTVGGAQPVDCDVTPYYGVCPQCEAMVDVSHEPGAERLGAMMRKSSEPHAPTLAYEDCDMLPYRNGICVVE